MIDPSQNLDQVTNLLVRDGTIAGYDVAPRGDELVIDVSGRIVAPGLVDMHVHLREPGREEDETIESGTMTKDLALLVGPEQAWMTTEQFFEAIRVNLEAAMAEEGIAA